MNNFFKNKAYYFPYNTRTKNVARSHFIKFPKLFIYKEDSGHLHPTKDFENLNALEVRDIKKFI